VKLLRFKQALKILRIVQSSSNGVVYLQPQKEQLVHDNLHETFSTPPAISHTLNWDLLGIQSFDINVVITEEEVHWL
jgi:hypothetical protein